MSPVEEPLVFPCGGEYLVGILTRGGQTSTIGVLIVTGGPQYRAGSHRQFVLLARVLAASGHAVLRFDTRGRGDSGGSLLDFQQVDEDIGAALEALRTACPEVRRVVLLGLCDGASAALLYCDTHRGKGIDGLILINPWIRSDSTLARTRIRHYYGQRLLAAAFWKKLVAGQVGIVGALEGLWRNLVQARKPGAVPIPAYPRRMARAWRDFDGPILLALSGRDYTAKEFLIHAAADPAWRGLLQDSKVTRLDMPGADHTFSAAPGRCQLEAAVLGWLREEKEARQCAAS